MKIRPINASDAPAPVASYAQAVEVTNAARILYISGQIPVGKDGSVPSGFGDQFRMAWANIEAQLRAADMTLDNLVKITVFLADRRFAAESREVRRAILGDRRPALTVIIAGIFDAAWLVEIEAVAVA
jgi:2-iminobutanoate/2-iminopropanoate deaminase